MSPSVQKQLQQQHAVLMKAQADRKAGPALGEAYGEMGKMLMAAEYRNESEGCYLNARLLAPSDIRWPYYLGHLYQIQGDSARAAAAFEQAVKAGPNDVPALTWLGEAYLAQNRPDAAEPLFEKARSLDPQSIAAVFGLGRALLARQQYARAVEYLEQALTIDPQASIIHYPLAMAYRGSGDRARADDHLKRRGPAAIHRRDPLMEALDGSIESAVAYEVRGARALDDGKWTEAATYFRKGIELAPDEPSLRHKLGTALAMTGDARGAMEQFREAVRRSPGFVKAHYSLGLLLAGDGRVGEALDEFSAALKEDPTYAEARLQLAEILRRLGRLPDALRQYDQVIQTDPRLADARFGAAIVLGRMSRFGEARARLIDARRLHPDHVRIAIALARILAAAPGDTLRNGTEAMVIVQQINDRGIPNEPAARVELIETAAMASAEAGQFDRAIGAQREAIGMAEAGGRHDLAQRMAGNLKLYESRRPSRTPWREDEF